MKENTEKKVRILSSCKAIPTKNLVNFIKEGIVSLSELLSVGLPNDKAEAVKTLLKEDDDNLWGAALLTDTPEAYSNYLAKFPDGFHSQEAKEKLAELEDSVWNEIQIHITKQDLENYLSVFPNGKYVNDCNNLLEDMPWLETKQKNTINDYENYKVQYPGKHVREIEEAINTLNDDNDWNNACTIGDTYAYRQYLNLHSSGKHAHEARNRIQASAGRDKLLSDLRENPNSHSAKEIKEKVKNNVATWDDIARVFGVDKTDAIKTFVEPIKLPESTPSESLCEGSTEVYFWGTPASGKTCALGSIISSAQKKGIYEPLPCPGYDYMTRLSNVFDTRGFCTFPDSTSISNIQEMIMNLRDKNNKNHTITLIDLAGELFRSAYFLEHNLFLEDEKKEALNTALSYLKDTRNNKIHFFVVEYGAQDKYWEGYKMVNYLDNMIGYLKRENIFTKSTVGVYVIVTKCDMIDCSPEDRPKRAFEYVSQELPAFWNTLQKTCGDSGVGDLRILSYSVGDVFAQNLCKFEGRDTDKVLDKFLTKTNAQGGFFSWLRK